MRAPPSGESAMCQRPPVERTIESPMASPRPAPERLGAAVEPVEQARPVGLIDAGPAILHGQADPAALGLDPDPDLPVPGRRNGRRCRPGRRPAGRSTPAAR